MAFFDSVYKSTKDFFGKSFSKDNKAEVSAVADNGVKVTFEGGIVTSINVDGKSGTKSVKKTGTTSIKLEKKGAPVSLDKLEFASNGTIKADVSLPNVVSGTKATFSLEDGSRVPAAKISGKFGVETVQKIGVLAGIKANFDAVQGDGAFSALLKHQGILAGANTTFVTPLAAPAAEGGDKPGFSVTGYDFLLGYATGAATFGVQTGKKATTATAFLHAAVSPEVTLAAQAAFPVKGDNKKAGIKGSIGGSFKVDKDVTVCAAVDQDVIVKTAATLAVTPKATVTLYGEIDALKIEQDGQHFFGTKLSLRA